jgi:hypothetical protein
MIFCVGTDLTMNPYSDRHFTSKILSPGKFYAAPAANRALETLQTAVIVRRTLQSRRPPPQKKCTDGDMVTLVTKVR